MRETENETSETGKSEEARSGMGPIGWGLIFSFIVVFLSSCEELSELSAKLM